MLQTRILPLPQESISAYQSQHHNLMNVSFSKPLFQPTKGNKKLWQTWKRTSHWTVNRTRINRRPPGPDKTVRQTQNHIEYTASSAPLRMCRAWRPSAGQRALPATQHLLTYKCRDSTPNASCVQSMFLVLHVIPVQTCYTLQCWCRK